MEPTGKQVVAAIAATVGIHVVGYFAAKVVSNLVVNRILKTD